MGCHFQILFTQLIAFSFQLVITQYLSPLLGCQVTFPSIIILVLIVSFLSINILGRTPNLHNIILTNPAQAPLVVWIPREIIHLRGVSTVHEQQFGWTVLGILGCLFRTDA